MTKFVRLALVLIAACSGAIPGLAQHNGPSNVAVMAGPKHDAPPPDKIADALRQCATELRVSDRLMPRIVLLVAGKDEARIADVHDWGHVFVENHPHSGNTVYMAWIVENVTDADLLQLFVLILNDNFSLGMTTDDAKALSRRLARRSMATASVDALLAKDK